MKYITALNGKTYEIEVNGDGTIVVDGQRHAVEFERIGDTHIVSLILDKRSHETVVVGRDAQWEVLVDGIQHRIKVLDELTYRVAQAQEDAAGRSGAAVVTSPMPGLILKVLVAEGDHIRAGDKLVILESMKMENELKAPSAGVVKRVAVEEGASVEKDQQLVMIGPFEEEAEQ